MLKSIKKRYKIIIIILAVLTLLPVATYIILMQPRTQKMIINRITANISETLDASISFGAIHFKFFNRLTAEDLLMLDSNNDTLLYAGEVRTGIRSISRRRKIVHLTKVTLQSPVFNIIRDITGTTNLQYYIKQIKKDPELRDSVRMTFLINQIEVTDGRFSLSGKPEQEKITQSGINFNDLLLVNINATIEDFSISDDTTSMYVYRASFNEKSGFSTDRFSSNLAITRGSLGFYETEINTHGSNIKSNDFLLLYSNPDAFKNFAEEVKINLQLDKSIVSPNDLAYFIPNLGFNPGNATISGNLSGYVSQLRGRNFTIESGSITKINCSFDFLGLPDLDNTYIFIDIATLATRVSELERLGIVPAERIPDELDQAVGNMIFRGTFSGFTTDFVTYGDLYTASGSLKTDVSFRPTGRNNFKYQGMMEGSGIEAGKLTGADDLLGKVSFRINADGSASSIKEFNAKLDGVIESAEFNDHIYRDIELNGTFSENTWDGSVNVNDDNLELSFIGMLDFESEIPEFDFSLNIPNANLYNLGIDKSDSTSAGSFLITSNFKGNSFDNLSGEIKLLNSTLKRSGRSLDIYNGSLTTWTEEGMQTINLNSDFVNASMIGVFNFADISISIKSILTNLLPSIFEPHSLTSNVADSRFELKIQLKDTDLLNSFLNSGMIVAPGSLVDIRFGFDEMIDVNASSDFFSFRNFKLEQLEFTSDINDTISDFNLRSHSFNIAGGAILMNFIFDGSAVTDRINLSAEWDNNEKILDKGKLSLHADFSIEDEQIQSVLSIDSSTLFVRNTPWKINAGVVSLEKRLVSISEILINSNENFYRVSGTVSENKSDTLYMEFQGINLGALNNMFDKRGNDKVRLAIGGSLSGRTVFTGLLGEMMIETEDVIIEDFRIIEHDYGNIFIESVWDNRMGLADIGLHNELDGERAIEIDGHYNPEIKELNLTVMANGLPIDILNPLLSMFASDIKGYAYGEIDLSGKIKEPVIEGSLFVSEGSMKVDYLQTQYFFSDSIRFDKSGIYFSNIPVVDDRGNNVRVNGSVSHSYFKDYVIDIAFNANQVKVLDTRQKDNDMFYGTAFATGVFTIKGSEGVMAFDISAKTDRNTRFIIPLSSSQSIGDYSFITFTGSDLPITQGQNQTNNVKSNSESSLALNIDLDVTPDAEVQLVLDSKAGDIMRGRGTGKLNIKLTPKGEFGISGDYIINTGDYLFTLGNILNKRFNVEEGGRISWNGDITDADIDIWAKYRLEASLTDLLQDERYQERIPVECLLHMTGKLQNPVIGFDINLPTADEQTRSYLKNAINTDEEMSRQFLYLLVMNRFYPDPAYLQGGNVIPTTGAGSSALGNTMEMVSNQLTNWLSQISNDFDVGFVYRPGNEISTQEVELALSTQLLNDRITINGNFDVGSGQTNTSASSVTGVFDVEVKITEKLRFKFFNRSNDNIHYETAPYTQGIGIFFRHDFDKLRNIFKNNRKKKE